MHQRFPRLSSQRYRGVGLSGRNWALDGGLAVKLMVFLATFGRQTSLFPTQSCHFYGESLRFQIATDKTQALGLGEGKQRVFFQAI